MTLGALCHCFALWGQDAGPANLRGELPLRIEDALVAQHTGVRILIATRYDHTGEDPWRVNPGIQFNVPRHWQFGLSSRIADDNNRADSRFLRISAAHQFLTEGNILPNLAASAAADVPRGSRSAGIDARAKALFTKTVTHSFSKDRIHFNMSWVHNSVPRKDERENFYRLTPGYSRNLGAATVFVTDFSREQRRSADSVINVAEFGIRQRVGEKTIISFGGGRD